MGTRTRRFRQFAGMLMLPGLLLVLACGAKELPPLDEISEAVAAITSARENGAEKYAPLELRFAEQKLLDARAAVKDEDFEEARHKALEASADARFAEARSLAEKSEKRARNVEKGLID